MEASSTACLALTREEAVNVHIKGNSTWHYSLSLAARVLFSGLSEEEAKKQFSKTKRIAALPSHIETTIDSYARRGQYFFFIPDVLAGIWQSQRDVFSLEIQFSFVHAVSGCYGSDMALVNLRGGRMKLIGSFKEGALDVLSPHFEKMFGTILGEDGSMLLVPRTIGELRELLLGFNSKSKAF